jgi:hypothetical protein
MNREWKKYAGGALAVLLGFGIADRCFGKSPEDYTDEDLQRLCETSADCTAEDIQEMRVRGILSEVEKKLSAATIKAVRSLKTRVFDPTLHVIQAEYLNLVQETSLETSRTTTEQDTAKAALRALKRLGGHPARKVLLVRALASAIGGAKWISKYIPNDPVELATHALRVLLKLSEQETLLGNRDCLKVRQKLYERQVFQWNSPFWSAVRSLTLLEREQLGDCFGDLPRSFYEKRREYFRLQDQCTDLYKRIRQFCINNRQLDFLVCYLEDYHKLDLMKNGFHVPEGFRITDPKTISDIETGHMLGASFDGGYKKRRVMFEFMAMLGWCPWPAELRTAWVASKTPGRLDLKVIGSIRNPRALPETWDLEYQFQEAQTLFDPRCRLGSLEKETVYSLERKMEDLRAQLKALQAQFPSRYFPQENGDQDLPPQRPIFPRHEGLFRRDLIAGRPNANEESADSTGSDRVFGATEYGRYSHWEYQGMSYQGGKSYREDYCCKRYREDY